jgi:hypothetical protein
MEEAPQTPEEGEQAAETEAEEVGAEEGAAEEGESATEDEEDGA